MEIGSKVRLLAEVWPDEVERDGVLLRFPEGASPFHLVSFSSGHTDFLYEDEFIAISPMEQLAEVAD